MKESTRVNLRVKESTRVNLTKRQHHHHHHRLRHRSSSSSLDKTTLKNAVMKFIAKSDDLQLYAACRGLLDSVYNRV